MRENNWFLLCLRAQWGGRGWIKEKVCLYKWTTNVLWYKKDEAVCFWDDGIDDIRQMAVIDFFAADVVAVVAGEYLQHLLHLLLRQLSHYERLT